MMRRAFVGCGQFEKTAIVPHPAEQRDADGIAAAHETRGETAVMKVSQVLVVDRQRADQRSPEACALDPLPYICWWISVFGRGQSRKSG